MGEGEVRGNKAAKVYIRVSIYLRICIFTFNYLSKLHWI